jgi:methyl-accepting chemotaxis protein
MSFASIRITTRLALGFGLVLALIAAIVALAALTQREVGALSDQLTNVDYPKTRLVNRMLAANLENAKSVMELVVATEPAEVTAIQAAIEANRKSNATTMEELDKLLARPEAKTLYEALKQARARYIASRNKVMDLVVKDKNRDQAVALWTSDARLKLDVYSTSIRSLLEFQETLIHEDNRAIEQALSRNRQLNLVGGALALLSASASRGGSHARLRGRCVLPSTSPRPSPPAILRGVSKRRAGTRSDTCWPPWPG